MTENELRQSVLLRASDYRGLKMGDAKHRDIVDTYNSLKPLPRGYKVTYTDDWCCTFVTAIMMKNGIVDLIGGECGCGELINIARSKGIYCPKSYVPKTGDIIMYDFRGNDGWSDHTGFVVTCDGKYVNTIEGNVNKTVEYKTVSCTDKSILGYIAPNYASKSTPQKQYNATALGVAVANEYLETKAYPGDDAPAGYFILGTNEQAALGYGNQTDYYDFDFDEKGKKWLLVGIFGQKVWAEASKMTVKLYDTKPNIGERVRFTGTKLHTSSYLLSRGVATKPFTGVLEKVYEGRAYPCYVRADGNITDGFCKYDDLERI